MRYLNIDPLFATQYNRDWNFHHITEGGIKRKEKGGVGVGIYDAHVNFPRLLLAVDPCSLPEASTWRTAQALRLRYSSAVFYMSILPIKWNRFRSDVGGLNLNSQRRPKREREEIPSSYKAIEHSRTIHYRCMRKNKWTQCLSIHWFRLVYRSYFDAKQL